MTSLFFMAILWVASPTIPVSLLALVAYGQTDPTAPRAAEEQNPATRPEEDNAIEEDLILQNQDRGQKPADAGPQKTSAEKADKQDRDILQETVATKSEEPVATKSKDTVTRNIPFRFEKNPSDKIEQDPLLNNLPKEGQEPAKRKKKDR